MTKFIQNGNKFMVDRNMDHVTVDRLPVGNYVVNESNTPFGTFYSLELAPSFMPPERIYGDILRQSNRVLETFMSRSRGTGVMLYGEKGCGKTMMAHVVCDRAAKLHDVPTLIVSSPISGDEFNQFIQAIDQPAIVFFDEFEKIYRAGTGDQATGQQPQESLLTLFDGNYRSHKMFILTTNTRYGVDTHINGRPGRVYYAIEFDGVKADFVREYCADNLRNQEETDGVVAIARLFRRFTFDVLQALVEEMNRYNEPAETAIRLLNAEPGASNGHYRYDVELRRHGRVVPIVYKEWGGNVLIARISIHEENRSKKDEDGDYEVILHEFTAGDIVDVADGQLSYTYEKDDLRLVLREQVIERLDLVDGYATQNRKKRPSELPL